jgi:magnesium chelatase accessory protein
MRWPPPPDWPHAALSRRIACRPYQWHVQEAGEGPTLILVHGAGGSVHGWAGMLPILARTHRVIALDLPGHGWTQPRVSGRSGLDAMAADLARLIDQQGWEPAALIGHSAGAAIALRLALDRPLPVIGINAALGEFEGLAGWLFPLVARALALTPLAARGFAATASRARIARLAAGTGSTIPPQALDCYLALARDPGHVDGTLAMMADWRLQTLQDRLPSLSAGVTLIAAEGDLAVPPQISRQASRRIPVARYVGLPGLGHLAPEEAPEDLARQILGALDDYSAGVANCAR